MSWRKIEGYKFPYRISEDGEVQVWKGKWIPVTHYTENRTMVRLRTVDGKQRSVGVFRLLDECFCGGYARVHGLCVRPKNGVKSDCTLDNMEYRTRAETGRKSLSRSARKAVVRTDRHGGTVLYKSVTEAARKNGISVQALDRRMYGGVLDPRGYKWEVLG